MLKILCLTISLAFMGCAFFTHIYGEDYGYFAFLSLYSLILWVSDK